MATAAFFNTTANSSATTPAIDVEDRLGWGFALLLLTTATLFLRPADLLPQYENWPIYQFLIGACVLVSGRAFLRQLSHVELTKHPVSICMLALLSAIGLSHFSHGFVWGARTSMYEIGKLMVLYVLVVGLVNTPKRVLLFVKWITVVIATMASLAVLDRYEYITVAALESVQDRGINEGDGSVLVERIRGTGIFQDPNDFGLVLVTGIIFCAMLISRPHGGWIRHLWFLPVSVLLGTLALTHSRGALLALISAVPATLMYFRGGRFGAWPIFGIPFVAIAFAGRMTDVSAISDGTGQDRLQIWAESLAVWRRFPIFGIGEGQIFDEIGMVSHNSFLHCYAELGTYGGTAFLACFLAAGLGLWQQRASRVGAVDMVQNLNATESPTRSEISVNDFANLSAEVHHQRGFIFVALLASVASMLSISRQFAAPTYLILGLASAAHSLPGIEGLGASNRLRIGNRFFALTLFASAGALVAFSVVVRLFARW